MAPVLRFSDFGVRISGRSGAMAIAGTEAGPAPTFSMAFICSRRSTSSASSRRGTSTLPPYLPYDQVLFESPPTIDWDEGVPYDYEALNPPTWNGNTALNTAVGQITAIFQNQDSSVIPNLIPNNGDVAIYNDEKYMYSLHGSDFQAMMLDNLNNTQTISFTVTVVKTFQDEAIVKCTHVISNESNGSDTIYQMYRLALRGDRYVITDFMTSRAPIPGMRF